MSERLSTLDRFLPAWIGAAMVAGLLLGRLIPGLDDALAGVEVGSVSLPIAIGLLVMMYPVLAKVRYDELGHVTGDRRLLGTSILLNWVVGPALMFALAWLLLPDLPEYRTGLIIVGLARCIAMVLIWNDLACGDREAAAILVALNALFQIVAFALLGYFYLQVLPAWLGLDQAELSVSMGEIARSVLIFLGIPLLAGYLTRSLGERAQGREWYETTLLPRIAPAALYGLLFTVVVLFALQGRTLTSHPLDVARIAVPLLAYFVVMWGGSMLLTKALGFDYRRATAISFTAAGNNFELAIAVSIGVFGVASGQALAGVVGPLIEVPVLVGLVYVSLWARRFFPDSEPSRPPQVVFACVRNGGRSVIGRVLTEHYARGRVRAESAGTQPGEHIHPAVAEALRQLGLDVSRERPKVLTRETIEASAVAITLGCGEECPYVPGVRYVDWPVADPGGQDPATVRAIIADIDGRVRGLLGDLVPDLDLPPSVLVPRRDAH